MVQKKGEIMTYPTSSVSDDIRLYSVKEVASMLSISKNRVYDLIYARRIPAMDIGGLKVRHEALAKYLKDMEGYMVDFDHPEIVYGLPNRMA